MNNKFHLYSFLLIFVASCTHYAYRKSNIDSPISKSISPEIPINNGIQKMISPYKKQLDEQMNKVLSYTPIDLNKNGFNSPLANLMADLTLQESNLIYKSNIDICVLNHGGIRKTLNKGVITTRDIYEVMPFENEAVVVTLSSKQILEMVDYLSESTKGHPIAGIEFKPFTKESIKINGKPFKEDKTYTVVTNDYLQKGGDQMYFLAKPLKLENLNVKLRDMMLNYFSKNDTIKINTTQRILK